MADNDAGAGMATMAAPPDAPPGEGPGSGDAGQHGSVDASGRRLRLTWRRAVAAVAGLGALAGASLLLTMQSPLPVRSIDVAGVGPDLAPAVAAAVGNAVGQSFRSRDAEQIAARVAAIEGIDGASVGWSWWNRLSVVVDVPTPVGAVAANGAFLVLDSEGATIRRAPDRPESLPLIEARAEPSRRIAVDVAAALPESLAPVVEAVIVTGDSAQLRLRPGATAKLGSPEGLAEKFAVLEQLLPLGAEEYNVAVPKRPAVQGIPAPQAP